MGEGFGWYKSIKNWLSEYNLLIYDIKGFGE
jgi:hypothetical protein